MSGSGAWEDAVREAWTAAQKRWPEVGVELDVFQTYVESRVEPDGRDEAGLAGLSSDELYLACGCARWSGAALAAFEREYFVHVDPSLARIRGLGEAAADVKQALREELFSPDPDRAARIESYSGRGSLLGWLRVTTVRSAHKLVGRQRREASMADHLIAESPEGPKDEELEYFKRLYRREFKEAFEAAVAGLQRRERNLLRHHVVDQLSIDQISAIYHVHRSTAARQIERARQTLREQTRERLLAQLEVGPNELESIVRMVDTQLDLSVYRVLAGSTRK